MPIRSAVLSDVNGLQAELVEDLMMEFAQLEGASCGLNNDQAGSTTTATGGTDGLRGLNSYPGAAGAAAAFGTSGTAITNGRHTIRTVGYTSGALEHETLTEMASALPGQYWNLPGTAWMMSPSAIQELRDYVHGGAAQASYAFVENGADNAGALTHVFGFPVIVNPYLDAIGTAGAKPVYLGNWPRFMTIADVEEMTIQAFEQTAPGFTTMYAEKRMVSTVRDVFAGVRAIEV
jgi:HK97 family phage major capsid protein